ncbi:MAG: EAL domain-containing protein [Pseudomonadota bacterium]|nr:EAL domain-containing protein [Pseudomonadota bacterium]
MSFDRNRLSVVNRPDAAVGNDGIADGMRVRAVVMACLSLPVIWLLFGIVLWILAIDLVPGTVILVLASLVLAISPALYLLAPYRLSVNPGWVISAGLLLLSIYVNVYLSGGTVGALFWFLPVALIGYLVLDRRHALALSIVTGSCVAGFAVLYLNAYQFPDLPDPGTADSIGVCLAVAATAYGFLLLWLGYGANYAVRDELLVRARTMEHDSRSLSEEKDRALGMLQSIADGVITTDSAERVQLVNPAARALTGWSGEEARGRPLGDVFSLFDEKSRRPVTGLLKSCLRDGTATTKGADILVGRAGTKRQVSHSASPIRAPGGEIEGAIIVFHDVSSERELQKQLYYHVIHDALTGLLNRGEFERRLSISLGETTHEHVLCLLDIEQFKLVNDTYGHGAGDEFLRQLGHLLKSFSRTSDAVARTGGDEFAVLLTDCPVKRAEQIAEEMRERVAAQAFQWEDRSIRISVNIGIVPLSRHEFNMTQALSAAGEACFAAKQSGRNRIHVYHPDDSLLMARSSQMKWIGPLHEALQHDSFLLTRQILLPLGSDVPAGKHYEILLRLPGKNGELVRADNFLSAAERFKLMGDIDRSVLKSLVDWFEENPDELEATEACAVNLSGHTINDDSSTGYIHSQLDRIDGLAARVCFEITETTAIANLRRAGNLISDLKVLGCRFALDDFGKGMSSLAYLKNLPVDFLKIDGQFVRNIDEDPIDRAMVEAVNQIGHVLGMVTIAEYVENRRILEIVREIGVDYAQGYEVGHPELLPRQGPVEYRT